MHTKLSLKTAGQALAALMLAGLLSACGGDVSSQDELPADNPQIVVVEPTDVVVVIPPTNTPPAEPLPVEQLGPVSIDPVSAMRAQEPVVIDVQRGKQVTSLTCSAVSQTTGRSTTLATPTSRDIDDSMAEDTFTFTPEEAGTYVVNCSGLAALTTGDTRTVTAASSPFQVDAKG